jgi:hypothetical protein
MMAEVATLFPDQSFGSSADGAASPADSGQADTAPPTPAVEETPTPAPKPAPAPKHEKAEVPGTLTEAEVEARIADATKRSRADQSAMAKQVKEMQSRLEAREQAFGQLVEAYRGTQVEGDALRQWMQSENSVNDRLAEEQRVATETAQQSASLVKAKWDAASDLYNQQYGPLSNEAGHLGLSETDLQSIIDGVMKSPDFASFHEAFNGAPTIEDALRVAKPGYVLMGKEVRAQLQQKKIDSLKEPEPEKPKPERTIAHGTGGATPDPLSQLPIGERGKTRLREGVMADALRVFQLEQ